MRATLTDKLTACRAFAALKRRLPPAASVTAAERTAWTHALSCTVCGPIATEARQQTAATTARLTAEAREDRARWAIPVIDQAAMIVDANGYSRHYLWDTAQAQAGTPREYCRVDIAGAIAVALYGNPSYAGDSRVRAVEDLVAEHVDAPSLTAWYSYPGVGTKAVLEVLWRAADALRAELDRPAVARQIVGGSA